MVRKIGGSRNRTQKKIGRSTAETIILVFMLTPPVSVLYTIRLFVRTDEPSPCLVVRTDEPSPCLVYAPP